MTVSVKRIMVHSLVYFLYISIGPDHPFLVYFHQFHFRGLLKHHCLIPIMLRCLVLGNAILLYVNIIQVKKNVHFESIDLFLAGTGENPFLSCKELCTVKNVWGKNFNNLLLSYVCWVPFSDLWPALKNSSFCWI